MLIKVNCHFYNFPGLSAQSSWTFDQINTLPSNHKLQTAIGDCVIVNILDLILYMTNLNEACLVAGAHSYYNRLCVLVRCHRPAGAEGN